MHQWKTRFTQGTACGILLLLVAGCEPVPPGQVPSLEDGLVSLHPCPDLNAQIAAAKQDIEQDRCFIESADDSSCDWASYSFSPDDFAMNPDKNTGESILVIDVFPSLPTGMLRFRNRLKGYYRVQPGGFIEPASHTWRVPKVLGKVLTSFASPDFIPASHLSDLASPIYNTYRGHLDMFGHGLVVFSALVDRVPHNAIVLLDQESLTLSTLALNEFCEQGADPQSLKRLTDVAQTTADELRRVMREMDVRYINASFGYSLRGVRSEWQYACEGPLPSDDVLRAKMSAYTPIVDALFNTEGVFAAHASADIQSPEDSPFDIDSAAYPNRLRIGFFGAPESGLDERGQGATQVPDFVVPRLGDADVYVNHGCDLFGNCGETALRLAGLIGVGSTPMTSSSTSWMTPVALARYISLRYRDHGTTPMSNELIQTLKGELTPNECPAFPAGRCIFQDPLQHKQFEVYRLGYMN